MIDLEKEREAFEEHFNGEYEYVFGECFNQENGYFYEGKHDKSAYFAFEAWKKCAESKQSEIDSLKAQLANIESDEYLVVKKEVIENWYLDEGEYVWYEKDSIDSYLEDLDNGEVLEVQRKEYVVINSNPVFATNVYEDADNIQWELFDSKEEAEKSAAHCKAMTETAKDNSNEDDGGTKDD